MSKPIKGVIPAKKTSTENKAKVLSASEALATKSTNTSISKEESGSVLQPIKKSRSADNGTKTIHIPKADPNQKPPARIPDKEELDYITNAIVDKLMGVFVTRDEIREVVEKTLQDMVANKSAVSKK